MLGLAHCKMDKEITSGPVEKLLSNVIIRRGTF